MATAQATTQEDIQSTQLRTNDAAVETFREKFTEAYRGSTPAAAITIPWDAILAALLSLFGGCAVAGPEDAKRQIQRPIVKARFRLKLLAMGVATQKLRDKAVSATEAAIEQSSNEEITAYIAAAREAD